MARKLARDGRMLDYARYPIPAWQPQDGFTVDPALLYALMRQESGFRSSATNGGSGALGLMQLMPRTARMMKDSLAATSISLASEDDMADPVTNITLGQGYVRHLLENGLVQGNLIYMLTAYNAGPGRLAEWKAAIDYRGDPLLFIESIPSRETRVFIERVLANMWIYRIRFNQSTPSLDALAAGEWPGYDPQNGIGVAQAVERD